VIDPRLYEIWNHAPYRGFKVHDTVNGGMKILIHVNVSEEVYKRLSKEADDVEMSIGDYVSWTLTETIPEIIKTVEELEERIEEILKETKPE